MARKKPVAAFEVPKELGTCADLLYTTRQERLATTQDVKEFAAQETLIKNYVIDTLPKSNASGVSGKLANVKVGTEDVPTVTDWDAFYKFVKKTNGFHLLQRRIVPEAIQEIWDAGKKVPGVGTFKVVKVSVTKI